MPTHPPVDLSAVREVSTAVSAAHLFVYLVPEIEKEAADLGVTDRAQRYFAFRSAAMGAVPWQVTLAAFYGFSPQAVRTMAGVWDVASPEQWQAARFAAVAGAVQRVGASLAADRLAEARSLIDPVVANAGIVAREEIEIETDRHCAALWAPIGEAGARRFAALIAPINDAFTKAGTYGSLH
ncbi:helix-turn-helix domain-containing protein [Amycolatopsis sp. cmx-4-68]|uniref:helix-turn-helix domain-containing protein n=1 Tax=Amycolatopsis sp. cmx-4-68 TaxID=2790938 RepID=UPI00397822BD